MNDRKRIAVDLDGTICETKRPDQNYSEVLPLPGAVESLQQLKASGFYIVVYTARNMRTCNNNLGAITKNQAGIVTNWLKRYSVPYDELLFGKPWVDWYIDDKAIKFVSWEQAKKELGVTDV